VGGVALGEVAAAAGMTVARVVPRGVDSLTSGPRDSCDAAADDAMRGSGGLGAVGAAPSAVVTALGVGPEDDDAIAAFIDAHGLAQWSVWIPTAAPAASPTHASVPAVRGVAAVHTSALTSSGGAGASAWGT
jgi:hypothetical protein